MMILSDICSYRSEKVKTSQLSINNYISTENMLPNKMGIEKATNIPSAEYTPRFYKDDILISNIRPYFKKIWQANIDGGCSTDVLVFKNKHKIDPIYLYYILSDDNFFNHAMATSKGTKMPRGDKLAIMNYSVPDFDLNSQIKIGRILRNFDDKIFLNQQQNNNLEQQAQALFKSWFVDFEPFGGKMPDDWKVGKLGDIADVIMGQSPSGNSYNEKGIGCIFFQGRAEFGFRFPTIKLFTTEPKRIAKQNDILMSVRAPVGDFNVAYDDCCIGRGLCAIRSKDNFQSFILYTLWSVQNKLDVFNGEGTVFGSINKDSLNNLEIIVPDTRTIQKFENLCSPMDNLIRKNYEENTRLAAIRDTLLPKLMSGEIDVSKVNISADKLSFILLFIQSDQAELKVTRQEKSDPIIPLVFIGVWDIPDQPEFLCLARNMVRLKVPAYELLPGRTRWF